jgi:hypothetical protein
LIAEFGNLHDYDMIFGTSGGGNIVFGSDAMNLTERFLAFLEDHPASNKEEGAS